MLPKSIEGYKFQSHLGKGGYGNIYKAINLKDNKEYALKLSSNKETLYQEYNILMDLQGIPDSFQVYDYLEYPIEDVLVLELLGKDLSYSRSFKLLSFNCVCATAIRLLEIIEKIHEAGVLHRDIKPSNFLITKDSKNLKICDYGLSSYYTIGTKHKEFKTKRKCKGTAEYASINNHLGFRQSRRDDIESLCYSLMYLFNGELLWKEYGGASGFNKWKNILNVKVKISETHWFRSLPAEIDILLKYAKKLSYAETPNYLYLKTIFSKHVHMTNLYGYFDWYDIKKDTNIGKSSQIVEGATQITKLRRGKNLVAKRVIKKTKRKKWHKESKRSSFQDINKKSLSNASADNFLNISEKLKNVSVDKSIENSAEFLNKSELLGFNEGLLTNYINKSDDCFIKPNEFQTAKQPIKHFNSNNFLQLPKFDSSYFRRQNAIMSGQLKEAKSNIDIPREIIEEKTFPEDKPNSKVNKLSLTVEDISESTIRALGQDNISNSETPKSGYPEFKNKLLVLKNKNN